MTGPAAIRHDETSAPLLFADRDCPYAQRVRALLEHIGVPCELREAPFGQMPGGLAGFSPSGRVPFLVHGDVAIGESRVMLEYLAEVYQFDGAYSRDLTRRTLERHAMAVMDAVIAPRLMEERPLTEARLTESLDALEAPTASLAEPGLLAFHLAPLWLRFRRWRPEGRVTLAIRGRVRLAAWLDRAASLPAVVRTSSDADESVAAFHAARALTVKDS